MTMIHILGSNIFCFLAAIVLEKIRSTSLGLHLMLPWTLVPSRSADDGISTSDGASAIKKIIPVLVLVSMPVLVPMSVPVVMPLVAPVLCETSP